VSVSADKFSDKVCHSVVLNDEFSRPLASTEPISTESASTEPISIEPVSINSGESTSSEKNTDLQSAFVMFNQMSQQLAESYGQLEAQVAELNSELNTVTAQRFEELAEKECLANRLENLLSFLPGGVVVLDAQGRVAEANPAARDMLGEPLEGVIWREVIARCFAPRIDDGHEVSTRDGRRISIGTRSLDDGQIILLTDQTETRNLQYKLSRHERLSAMGKMVSALAHQIRTPLSAAMLYAGHLCADQLKKEQRQQFSEKLANRLNHMERQVQDMLLFVKGELPINEHCSVTQLQQALADEMEVPLMASGVDCQWHIESIDAELSCNKEALVGALLNLVNNALEAISEKKSDKNTDKDCLNITFCINTMRQLCIRVADTGPGIAAAQLEQVQEQFVTTKAQGTGLGLSVVQAVAKAHAGSFELQSCLGVGTKASMILPLLNLKLQTPIENKTINDEPGESPLAEADLSHVTLCVSNNRHECQLQAPLPLSQIL